MLKNILSSKTLNVDDVIAMESNQYLEFLNANAESPLIVDVIKSAHVSAEFLSAVLSYCKSADNRQQAQQQFEQRLENKLIDNNMLLEVVNNSHFVDSRKWAAEQLSDEASIKQAYKQIQSKDKNSARILHAKLDQLKAEAKTREAQQSKLSTLLQQANELSTAAYSPQYRGRYLLLVEQWNDLDFSLDDHNQKQFNDYCELIDKALQGYQQIDEANQRQESILTQLQSLWVDSQQQSIEQLAASIASISQTQIELDWHSSLAFYQPEDNRRELYQQFFQKITTITQCLQQLLGTDKIDIDSINDDYQTNYKLLDSLLNNQALIKGMGNTQWVKTLQEFHQSLAEQHQHQKQSDSELVKQLDKQFGIAFHLKKQGNFRPIHNHIERIAKKIGLLQQPILVKKMQLRLDALEKELQEATDWAVFALKPKFERLCSEMETLQQLNMPIQKKAQAIQKLQKQWKSLGFIEGSDDLWERFKTAADIAYAPCADYFQQQKQTRDKQTQDLVSLCEAVELLAESEQIDGEQQVKQMRMIDKDWYQKRDIDHTKIVELRERFKAAREKIEERLSTTYYADIIASRQSLIERLTKLADADVNAHAEHQVKLLQSAWKQSTPLPKTMDNDLWQQFKAQLDVFYQKRRELGQQNRQKANQPLDQAKTIVDELSELVKIASDDKRFQELQQQFNSINDLDGKRGGELKKRFQQLSGKLDKQLQKSKQQSRQSALDELKRRAQLCADLELGKITIDEVQQQWEHPPLDNNQWLQQINKRLERAKAGVEVLADNPHRRFCIDMEIALGLETPAQDKPLRMQIQMELLKNRGLQGDKITDKKDYLLTKQVEWLTLSISHIDEYDTLEQRFSGLTIQ